MPEGIAEMYLPYKETVQGCHISLDVTVEPRAGQQKQQQDLQ